MEGKTKSNTNKIIVIGVIIVLALLIEGVSHIRNRDVNFCRRAFSSLVKGRNSVQEMIDWPQFKAVGVDVGKTYLRLPGDREQVMFRKNFINRFATGFLRADGDYKSFVNWRIYKKEKDSVIIAADYTKKNKTLLFSLSKNKGKKVQAIRWKK